MSIRNTSRQVPHSGTLLRCRKIFPRSIPVSPLSDVNLRETTGRMVCKIEGQGLSLPAACPPCVWGQAPASIGINVLMTNVLYYVNRRSILMF